MLRVESFRKGIALSSAFNVVAKVLGFAANLAVAFYFGSHARTDVFFFAFGVVTIAAAYLTMLNSAVLIPEAMRIGEQEGKGRSMAFLNFFLCVYAAITIAVSIPAIVAPPTAFGVISKFDLQILTDHSDILRWSVPLLMLIVISGLLSDILTSYRFFTAPMLFSMLNSILVLVAIVVLHDRLNILSVLVGLTTAYVLQILIQVWVMARQIDWRFTLREARVRRSVLRNIAFSQAGGVATSLASYVPLYFLSGFSAGMVTALTYGQKMADLPTALVTTQASSVAGIKFNELMARGDWRGLDDVFARTVRMLLYLLVPVSMFMSIYGLEIMNVLFRRGAFTEESAATAAMFLRLLAWALPVTAVNTMVARINMASQRIRQAFWYQVTNNLVLIACIYGAVRLWGPFGYPVGVLAMNIVSLGALAVFVRLVLPDVTYAPVIKAFATALLVNLPVALVVAGWRALHALPDAADLVVGGSIYLALIIMISRRWRFNADAADFLDSVLVRLRALLLRRT